MKQGAEQNKRGQPQKENAKQDGTSDAQASNREESVEDKTASGKQERQHQPTRRRLRWTTLVGRIVFTLAMLVSITVLCRWAFLATAFGPPSESSPTKLPSIGLVAKTSTKLPASLFMANSPSIDLVPVTETAGGLAEGDVYGIFRINTLTTPDQGESTLGLVLPPTAVITPVGADGQLQVREEPARPVYKGWGFSCTTNGGPTDPTDPRRLNTGDFPIQDVGGNEYQIDCINTRTVVWVRLPHGRKTAPEQFIEGTQTVASNSAAHVYFLLHKYPGLTRRSYSSWNLALDLESAPRIDGAESIADAIGTKNQGVFTIGSSALRYDHASPPGFGLARRAYALPPSQGCPVCKNFQAIDPGPALTWSDLFDGGAREISADITNPSAESYYQSVTWLAALIVGLLVPAPWGLWRFVRRRH